MSASPYTSLGKAAVGAVFVVSAALISLPALANTVPITNSDIHAWQQTDQSYTGVPQLITTTNAGYVPGGVDFATTFAEDLTGDQYADVGGSFSFDANAGDTIDLYINNHNEHPWWFSILVNGAVVGSPVLIPNGTTQLVSVTLAAESISSIALRVAGDILGAQDRTAQYTLNVVPLPAGLALLGTGLLGLGLMARRKKAKADAGALAA